MANVKFYTGSDTLPTAFTEGALYFTSSGDIYYDKVGGSTVANDRLLVTNYVPSTGGTFTGTVNFTGADYPTLTSNHNFNGIEVKNSSNNFQSVIRNDKIECYQLRLCQNENDTENGIGRISHSKQLLQLTPNIPEADDYSINIGNVYDDWRIAPSADNKYSLGASGHYFKNISAYNYYSNTNTDGQAGTTTHRMTLQSDQLYFSSKANGTMDGEHQSSFMSDGIHFGFAPAFSGDDYSELTNQRLVLSGYINTSSGNSIIGGGSGSVLKTTTIYPDRINTYVINLQVNSSTHARIEASSRLITFTPQVGQTSTLKAGIFDGENWRLAPGVTGLYSLGSPNYRFTTVYISGSSIQTSDEREKNIFDTFDEDKYADLFMSLKPIKYTWKNKNIDTYAHLGLGAQTTEKALKQHGLDGENLGFVQYFVNDEGVDSYGMDYGDANMLTLMMTQKQEKEIVELKEKVAELEEQVRLLQIVVK